MAFLGRVIPPSTRTNNFPTSSKNLFKLRKIAKHFKKVIFFIIDLFWFIEQVETSKLYFSVYNNYEYVMQKVSFELYKRVEWDTLWFHIFNHYIHWNIDLILFLISTCHSRLMVKNHLFWICSPICFHLNKILFFLKKIFVGGGSSPTRPSKKNLLEQKLEACFGSVPKNTVLSVPKICFVVVVLWWRMKP